MLSAGIDMLDHLGHKQHSQLISKALWKTICEDKIQTPGNSDMSLQLRLSTDSVVVVNMFRKGTYVVSDLGGTASSTDVVQRTIDYILQADIRAW